MIRPELKEDMQRRDYREVPIPALVGAASALNYHSVPVALGEENEEPLVDLGSIGLTVSSYYARTDGRNAPYYRGFQTALPKVYNRISVAQALVSANHILRPYGVGLLVLDGWRPIELQTELWEHFVEKGRQALVDPTPEMLVQFAGRYCSDPRRFDAKCPETCPSHFTGAAVDVILQELVTGYPCEHGGIFDDASSRSETRFYEELKSDSQTDDEARRTRRLLYWAMTAVGLVNYPGEYWHYDHPRSQFGIFNAGVKGASAVFGPARLPV